VALSQAKLLMRRGEMRRAAEVADRELEALQDLRLWDLLVTAYEILGHAAREEDDYRAALAHLQAQTDATQRHLEQERLRRLAYLQVAFELDARNQEITLLREQARISELDEQSLRQRQLLRYQGYGVAIVLTLVLLLVLIRTFRQRSHYRTLSRKDSLTGLLNHTSFFESARHALEHARSRQENFWLILADIDHFKAVNDQHGHLMGDEVLCRVAGRLRESFEPTGSAGRIGGEEFAVYLSGANSDGIMEAVEQLRSSLQSSRVEDADVPITMSFGVAEAQAADNLVQLRQRADQALYQAKRGGRDGIRMASHSAANDGSAEQETRCKLQVDD
jgi:diguanylate cyclase (GGDEF)-like protein